MKTDVGIWSKFGWKFNGVLVMDPGLGVEYSHDTGVFEDWAIMT